MKKVRVDKWLWSVRIFKSRTKASDACRSNKVKIGESNLKPSHSLEGGEILTVKKNGFNMVFKVVTLIEKRVSATLAEPCYENMTSQEEMNKFSDWYIGKAAAERREKGTGRPTKRERRELDIWKEMDEEDD